METPKLLWLKEHISETCRRTAHFFDLPDFLTWRATGVEVRSLCSTVCKWTYLGHDDRWDDSYFRAIGLGDLVEEGYARVGRTVRPMGEPVGRGLSEQAAVELGLLPGVAVGVSIIDAHAGGLGMLGAPLGDTLPTAADMERRLALIGGTSSCHMAVARRPVFVPGVWGPYYSAMVPGLWLSEGGQSATGALIDRVIFSHARAAEVKAEADRSARTVYAVLNERLDHLARSADFPAALTHDLHVLPYFHGNRSPRADPTLKGVVSGLRLSDTIDDLALLYLATIQAVAHGTRHIIDAMNANGYAIETVFACGGGTKNPLFLREHADITGCRIVLPREPEAVLLGSAILGAVAAGDFGSVLAAMSAMNRAGDILVPATGRVAGFHAAKQRVFQRMHADFLPIGKSCRIGAPRSQPPRPVSWGGRSAKCSSSVRTSRASSASRVSPDRAVNDDVFLGDLDRVPAIALEQVASRRLNRLGCRLHIVLATNHLQLPSPGRAPDVSARALPASGRSLDEKQRQPLRPSAIAANDRLGPVAKV